MRPSLFFACLLLFGSGACAADACQDLVKLKELPQDYKMVGRSAFGPAELEVKSNGRRTCNDLPAVQRSLGQAQAGDVNWACDVAEAVDFRGK